MASHNKGRAMPGRSGQAAVEYFLLAMAALVAAVWLWNRLPQVNRAWQSQLNQMANSMGGANPRP